jgi:hypothetical protein
MSFGSFKQLILLNMYKRLDNQELLEVIKR